MQAAARHQLLAVSDSDVRIEPGALALATRAFADPAVGAVTCLYRGFAQAGASLAARLAVLQINGWFLPSAITAARLGPVDTCYGPLTVIRRSILEQAGGFGPLCHMLADDHELGQMAVRQGYRVELAPVVVETIAAETSLAELCSHEVRWDRTSQATAPLAFCAFFVTFSLPLVVALMGFSRFSLAAAVSLVALRMILVALTDIRTSGRLDWRALTPWFLALRETVCFLTWFSAFFADTVVWRGQRLKILPGGRLEPLAPELMAPAAEPVLAESL
jgi:ceramide glucosyltransferase